jgi:hypothetical protein
MHTSPEVAFGVLGTAVFAVKPRDLTIIDSPTETDNKRLLTYVRTGWPHSCQ